MNGERNPGHEAELTIRAPNGTVYLSIGLVSEGLTVGRLPHLNDVALEPDPQQLVTRQGHFVLEREGSRWVVVDKGSMNGTYVRRGTELLRVSGRQQLLDGDVICVVGRLPESGAPDYWEFNFDDRGRTRGAASVIPHPACLFYDDEEARLFLVRGSRREEVELRPQAHLLVRYMAKRNSGAGGQPVLCTHDELMRAVWADEPMHTREELNKLFWELRRKLQPLGAGDLVESARGLGYRLRTCS